MKMAFRHIQNDCVLCHANKVKDVRPMGECLHITSNFWLCVPVAPPSFSLALSLFYATLSFSHLNVLAYLSHRLSAWIQRVPQAPHLCHSNLLGGKRKGDGRLDLLLSWFSLSRSFCSLHHLCVSVLQTGEQNWRTWATRLQSVWCSVKSTSSYRYTLLRIISFLHKPKISL